MGERSEAGCCQIVVSLGKDARQMWSFERLCGAGGGMRTLGLLFTKQLLCH